MTDDVRVETSSPLGWAAYLGASWTWCIGMFLPVLLIRDYGPWAWVIFAIPNCVGAAAMGWVMRSRQQSVDYVRDHGSACRLFSFVTIAFQLFFTIWMLPRLLGPVGYFGGAVIIAAALLPLKNRRWLVLGGVVALVISFAAFAGMKLEHPLSIHSEVKMFLGDAIGLSLVCFCGFLLCPYLDLTFHRARWETSNSGAKVAFGIGFMLFFGSMIVLTLFYATDVRRIGMNASTVLNKSAMAFLALHWIVQMSYTVNVHAAELVEQVKARSDRKKMFPALLGWLVIGVAGGVIASIADGDESQRFRPSIGEDIYRLFISFYGLLFPVYVLLAIGRKSVFTSTWILIGTIAAPFYYIAFIEAKMVWAIAGVVIILGGALLARSIKSPALVVPSEQIQ